MSVAPKRPVPVFPLPGLVLFPHALLPLHVFELRYRTMVRDALAGERLIAIATLKQGWERDYHGSPEYHDLATVAEFETAEWLPNDCYDLRMRGAIRVRLGRATREFPYRACVVEPLPEAPYPEDDPLTTLARRELLEQSRRLLPLGAEAWLMPPFASGDLVSSPYEAVVNTIAQALRMPGEEKLALLAMDSVIDRGRRLFDRLRRVTSGGRGPEPGEGGARN